MDDLHNLNEMLAVIEDMGVITSAGTFVRMEDVRRLMLERKLQEKEAQPDEPPPKTWVEARHAAKEFLLDENGPPPPSVGRAVPAFVSPSAVEGV
jgi:hypothetical protein